MGFQRIEYTNSGYPGSPDRLVITSDGAATFESHSNEATPLNLEIGFYGAKLSADRLDSLASLLAAPPFASLPDHWGRLRPGEDAQRVRVVSAVDTTEKLVCEREPIDPDMQRVLDALEKVATELRTQPRRCLRVVLKWIDRNEEGMLLARLELTNPGKEILACRNPRQLLGAADGELSLQIWPDRPGSVVGSEDLLLLTPIRLEGPESRGKEEGTFTALHLAPGDRVEFTAVLPAIPGRSGSFEARALYANGAPRVGADDVLIGELYTAPIPFVLR